MLVILLIVIIAILLFGSAAVLGAAGAILAAISIAIVAVVFWSAGWVGLVAASGLLGFAILRARTADRREQYRALERSLALDAEIRIAQQTRETAAERAERELQRRRDKESERIFGSPAERAARLAQAKNHKREWRRAQLSRRAELSNRWAGDD